jgi:hypothetical protein
MPHHDDDTTSASQEDTDAVTTSFRIVSQQTKTSPIGYIIRDKSKEILRLTKGHIKKAHRPPPPEKKRLFGKSAKGALYRSLHQPKQHGVPPKEQSNPSPQNDAKLVHLANWSLSRATRSPGFIPGVIPLSEDDNKKSGGVVLLSINISGAPGSWVPTDCQRESFTAGWEDTTHE